MIDLVLVHTGVNFPDYLNDCIKQVKKYNINVHLIISDNLINSIEDKEISIIKESEVSNDIYKKYKLHISITGFRDNFLQRASSRFFLISEYAKKKNLKNFFHIENDVTIYDNLGKINKILSSRNFEASFVIDSFGRCVPSIVWFKNFEIVEKLCHFIFENNFSDDMKNLFLFFYKNREICSNFPITPDIKNLIFRSIDDIAYDNLFNEFECIFDGAAIGQYLGGIDSRNTQENSNTKGFINETTIFDVSSARYIFENNEPYMIIKDKKIKILNLHIHSKRLKDFIKNE